jgi:hypothetical protein
LRRCDTPGASTGPLHAGRPAPLTEEAALTLELALPVLEQAADDRVAGVVGDPDPLVAVQEVLARERFDEAIVSTPPARVSRWLRRDLLSRVQQIGDVRRRHLGGSRDRRSASHHLGSQAPARARPPDDASSKRA